MARYVVPTVWCGWCPRAIGFAPWVIRKRIDDPREDRETFHDQEERLSHILAQPDAPEDLADPSEPF